MIIKKREITPIDGRASFYGKAIVVTYEDGTKVLESYGTPVVKRKPDGTLARVCKSWVDQDGNEKVWSSTTGRHIKAFCGISKKEYMRMEVEEV